MKGIHLLPCDKQTVVIDHLDLGFKKYGEKDP
jgi:hypothetical protein